MSSSTFDTKPYTSDVSELDDEKIDYENLDDDINDIPSELHYDSYKVYFKSDKKSRGRVEGKLNIYREEKIAKIKEVQDKYD